jgi:hypothetical protein
MQFGQEGLLNQLTKSVLETALEAGMAEDMGYDTGRCSARRWLVHDEDEERRGWRRRSAARMTL